MCWHFSRCLQQTKVLLSSSLSPAGVQIHGNVCMRAVVVTPTLDWRLHGLDLLSEHQPATGVEWPLMGAAWMVGAQYKPAEVPWKSLTLCMPMQTVRQHFPGLTGTHTDKRTGSRLCGLNASC